MPCGKESSPRIAIGRKLLTEEPSCEAEDMTAPEAFAKPQPTLDDGAPSRHALGDRPNEPAGTPLSFDDRTVATLDTHA
jgi:hypothetical protein